MSTIQLALETVSEELTVKQQRAKYAPLIRTAIADEKRAAITAGCYFAGAKATFTLDEMDDWKVWACEVSGKSYKTVESYLAVAKAFTGSPRAVQTAVSDWTFEALQAFASVPAESRKAVVEMVRAEDSNPSPELVRTSRDIVKDEALTDAERAQKASDKKKRDKENAASKTEQLASDLKPLLKNVKTDAEFRALAIGIELGRAKHEEKILTDAIRQVRQHRDAGAAAVQTAAANLVAK